MSCATYCSYAAVRSSRCACRRLLAQYKHNLTEFQVENKMTQNDPNKNYTLKTRHFRVKDVRVKGFWF